MWVWFFNTAIYIDVHISKRIIHYRKRATLYPDRENTVATQLARDFDSMFWNWSTVCNTGPKSKQSWVNKSCFQGICLCRSILQIQKAVLSFLQHVLSLYGKSEQLWNIIWHKEADDQSWKDVTVNTKRRPNVGLMLGWRQNRRPNIKSTLAQCLVFDGRIYHYIAAGCQSKTWRCSLSQTLSVR